MSKKKRKVVVTTSNLEATKSNLKTSKASTKAVSSDMIFGRENYKWVIIGIALIALGMILMMGGFNDGPSVWDESKIYGLRRTLLAPVVILTGLAIEIYAIFK